jgi:putative transposase
VRDGQLRSEISRVFAACLGVYGMRKIWGQLHRQGHAVPPAARSSASSGESTWPARSAARSSARPSPAEDAARPGDLVDRQFTAPAPNRLWVANPTYVATWSGFVYVAFVMDVYSRRIVGWRCSTSLRTDLAADALEQGLWQRARDGHESAG